MLYIIGLYHDIRLGSEITFENYVAYVLDTEKLTISVKPAVEFMQYLLFDLGMVKFSDEPILDIQCPYTGKQKVVCKDYSIPNKLKGVQGIDAIVGTVYRDKVLEPTAYYPSYATEIEGFYYNLGGGYIRFLDRYYKCNFEVGDLVCETDDIGVICYDLREHYRMMQLCSFSLHGISEVKLNFENFGNFMIYGNDRTKCATNPDGSAIKGLMEVRPREALLSCTKGCKV